MLEVTVLGSGTIIPIADRSSSAVMLRVGGENLLFDCGPGVLCSAAARGFGISEIDRVFISHFHPDHTLGLGHFIAAARNDPDFPAGRIISLYGPGGIAPFLNRWECLYHSFGNHRLPFSPVAVREGGKLLIAGSEITAAGAEHGNTPALSFRVENNGTSFVYTGDTAFSQELVQFCRGADIIASECSFPDGSDVQGHMTVSDVGMLAREAEPGAVILLHMYPMVDIREAEAAVRQACSAEVLAGYDGLSLSAG